MNTATQTFTLGQRLTLRLYGDVLPTLGLLIALTLAMSWINS